MANGWASAVGSNRGGKMKSKHGRSSKRAGAKRGGRHKGPARVRR